MSTLQISPALLNSRMVRRAPSVADVIAEQEAAAAASLATAARRQGLRHPAGFGPYGQRSRQFREYDRGRSRRRRRIIGGDGRLPNTFRGWFTEGERAVLSFIAKVVKKYGRCEHTIQRIAAGAGVSVRLVQYTLAKASGQCPAISTLAERDRPPRLIMVEYRPRKGAKSLPNIIKIISREWINWLSYRPSEVPAVEAAEDGGGSIVDLRAGRVPGPDVTGCRKVHTTWKPISFEVEGGKEPPRMADNWRRFRRGLPSREAYEDLRARDDRPIKLGGLHAR